jgi:Protein of unknown function (DUF3618)
MGKTAADTRREIEQTRRQLGATVTALRARTVVVRGRAIRVAVIAGGALGAGGVGLLAAVMLRRRRGGVITRAARHLPAVAHDAALPLARSSDRWLRGRAQSARARREEIVEDLATRIADNQAQAQRRANPLWRRAAGTALETAASAGMAALVRRAMTQPAPASPIAVAQLPAAQRDLVASPQTQAAGALEPEPVGASGHE